MKLVPLCAAHLPATLTAGCHTPPVSCQEQWPFPLHVGSDFRRFPSTTVFESLLLLFLHHLFLMEIGADGVDQHLVDADCEVVMDDQMDDPHLLTQIGLVQSPATTATTLDHQQMPSDEQQQGIAALYALNDSEIFGYLTALRSLKANLTNKQLKALRSLSSAPNDHIKTWLDFGRRISGMAIWKSIERGRLNSPRR